MYSLLWRVLPGPGFVKFVQFLGVIGAAVYGLWFYAFPWADPHLPFHDVTVEAEGGGAPAEPAPDDGEGDGDGEEEVPADGEGDEDVDEDEEGIVGVDIPIGEEEEAPQE